MYKNIGFKIKTLAKGLFLIGSIGSIITGILLIIFQPGAFVPQNVYVTFGITTIITGPLTMWLVSVILYGFGFLVAKAETKE